MHSQNKHLNTLVELLSSLNTSSITSYIYFLMRQPLIT